MSKIALAIDTVRDGVSAFTEKLSDIKNITPDEWKYARNELKNIATSSISRTAKKLYRTIPTLRWSKEFEAHISISSSTEKSIFSPYAEEAIAFVDAVNEADQHLIKGSSSPYFDVLIPRDLVDYVKDNKAKARVRCSKDGLSMRVTAINLDFKIPYKGPMKGWRHFVYTIENKWERTSLLWNTLSHIKDAREHLGLAAAVTALAATIGIPIWAYNTRDKAPSPSVADLKNYAANAKNKETGICVQSTFTAILQQNRQTSHSMAKAAQKDCEKLADIYHKETKIGTLEKALQNCVLREYKLLNNDGSRKDFSLAADPESQATAVIRKCTEQANQQHVQQRTL